MKVKTIARGTPITTDVLQEHAQAINDLNDSVFSRTNGLTIRRDSVAQITRLLMDSQVWAEQIAVITSSIVSAGQTESWSTTFSPAFASTPVVTVSAVVPTDAPTAAKKAEVKITSQSANGVSGFVYFPDDGTAVTLAVSIIAIGIPTT